MKTITTVQLIGNIDGTPERKTVGDKPLTEFRIDGIGLRISAWRDHAAAVPNSGIVIVNGYLSTRSYTHTASGEQRQSTEIIAQSVQVLDAGPAIDSSEPF